MNVEGEYHHKEGYSQNLKSLKADLHQSIIGDPKAFSTEQKEHLTSVD